MSRHKDRDRDLTSQVSTRLRNKVVQSIRDHNFDVVYGSVHTQQVWDAVAKGTRNYIQNSLVNVLKASQDLKSIK